MGRSKTDNRLTYSQSVVCSGVAGVTSHTITAPFDVVKILSQVGTADASGCGMLRTFRNVHINEGLRAFWKGNLMGCMRLFPYSAIQFSAFQKMKLKAVDSQGRMSPMCALTCGAGGGVIATISMYPTDTVKTRLIVQKSKSSYRGIANAFAVIMKTEGIFALYKGMSVAILGAVPYAGTSFMVYEFLDKLHRRRRWQWTPLENFFNGCLASGIAQAVSYPFDTIKKKLQAQSKVLPNDGGVDVKFKGVFQAFARSVQQRGFLSLWNGLTPTLLRIVPQAGTMFMVWEACRRLFIYDNGYTTSPFLDQPRPGLDQSLAPEELKESRRKQKDTMYSR